MLGAAKAFRLAGVVLGLLTAGVAKPNVVRVQVQSEVSAGICETTTKFGSFWLPAAGTDSAALRLCRRQRSRVGSL